ncbi:MAG: cyclase family protein [Candidatus Dormibacteraceae bacterium]
MRTFALPMSEEVDQLLAALGRFDVVDLSHPLEESMPVFPVLSKYYHMLWFSTTHGDAATAYQFLMNEHCGTHVDAPAHYVLAGHPQHRWVDQVPPERWMGRAAIIDCRDVAPALTATPAKIADWEAVNGRLREGDIAVFHFGWAQLWARHPEDVAFQSPWPGVGLENAEILIDRGVKAVGVDTFSPDARLAEGDPFHRRVLPEGMGIIECLANLDRLPPVCYLQVLPLPIRDGSGSPVRAVALVPHR